MATVKQYAYYLKGNKIAIAEKDFTAVQNGQTLTAPSIDLPQGGGTWKSPLSTVADGLEIEYVYSPTYRIETTNDVDQNITQYQSVDGKLAIADNTSGYTNYVGSYALAAGSYIVLRNAGKFNGLHNIASLGNNGGTNNKIILETSYNGSEAAWTDFEETVNLYYVIDVLNDESDEIDLSSYLSKALVYYVKGRLAEDAGQMDMREFFLKEFRKMVEKSESSKIYGSRMIMPGSNAIR